VQELDEDDLLASPAVKLRLAAASSSQGMRPAGWLTTTPTRMATTPLSPMATNISR
jgi:hypothetical protein